MKRGILATAIALVFATAAPLVAHHSFAMFDLDPKRIITKTGRMTELEWNNPHAWIHIAVKNAAGVEQDWPFEMGSPGQLTSKGWTKDIVKVGDIITITAHPMKDGSRGGNQITVTLANGTVLGGQPTTGR